MSSCYDNVSNTSQITSCYCRECVDHILKCDYDKFKPIVDFISFKQQLPDSTQFNLPFSEFIAFKHTRQEIHNFMTPYINCQCCSRHTGDSSLPDLPQVSKGFFPDAHEHDYQEPNACTCNCRHQLRILTKSIDILINL